MKDFFCLVCDKEMLNYSTSSPYRFQCKKCHSFLEENETGNIVRYDYDQVIKGVKYLIMSFNNQLMIHNKSETIVSVEIIEINNQQEFEELAPRLLKMKAFI